MVAALAAVVAAFAAVVTAGVIVWQTQRTTHVQALMQLLSKWESQGMQQTRALAAGSILAKQPLGPYVDDVLDFFETVAIFSRRRYVDKKIIWHTFYWPMVCYWQKSKAYIREAQEETGSETWKDYADLMPVLIRREADTPSAEAVESFFTEETGRAESA